MWHVQNEHDPAAVGLLEDFVFVGVVDFDAPVLFPGDSLVVNTQVDIAFGHFDSQVVAHASVAAEVCGGTCVFGFMIEKNAIQPMLPTPVAAAQELRYAWTLARVVDLEVAEPIVKRENGPVAAVRQSASVVPRVDLVLVRVDTGEFLPKHVDVPLQEFADLVGRPDWVAGQMEQNKAGISLAQRSPQGTCSRSIEVFTWPAGVMCEPRR